MSKKPALGRGIDALLASKSFLVSGKTVSTINIKDITVNPYQPRVHFDDAAIQELAHSIQQHGLIQPILVRHRPHGYELVAGERRLRASQFLNNTQIPAIVKDISDKEAMQLALVENLDRESLSPIEEAKGFQRLIEEFHYTHAEIADIFGKSRSVVTNLLRLLTLPTAMQQALMEKKMAEGHGRFLLSIEDKNIQQKAFELVVQEGWSIRELTLWLEKARRVSEDAEKVPVSRETQDILLSKLERQVSEKHGLTMHLKGNSNKGRLVVKYRSPEELEKLMALLG